MFRSALIAAILLFGLGVATLIWQQGLLLFVTMTFLAALFWHLMNSKVRSVTKLSANLAKTRPNRPISVLTALPLGAATVFALTIPISLGRALIVQGGLTQGQGVATSAITLVILFAMTLSLRGRIYQRVSWFSRLDLVPALAALLVALVGLISTFTNRVTALAIFMAGGDHANHVGRAVSILNAGAAGSVDRAAFLRPGGLNPLHFLAAELFSVEGGTANFADAADFYLFFARFEWLQLGLWVLVTGITSQVVFALIRSTKRLSSDSWLWGMQGAALFGIFLLALPFVGSTGLLGFSTSVSIAWIVFTPAILLVSSGLKARPATQLFFGVVLAAALVVISIRSSNAFQVLAFPILLAAFWLATRRKMTWSWRTGLLVMSAIVLIALFVRVLGPYVYLFFSAGNPTGTSEEPDFWLFVALLLIASLGLMIKARNSASTWLWAWGWATLFGILAFMTFLTVRFGSTPNDPDYLVSRTLFAGVAFILPFAAGSLMAFVITAVSAVSVRAAKVAAVVVPLALLLVLRPDAAWGQVFTAWSGQGHPMTWYSAPFSRGLPENAYAFSLKNRDATWLAALSREAYSLPTLTYNEIVRPDPIYGTWDEMSLCKFLEENEIKTLVTDGFELQGALTDCPAAAPVSYLVPPRATK